jgi:hypothetical protein
METGGKLTHYPLYIYTYIYIYIYIYIHQYPNLMFDTPSAPLELDYGHLLQIS